MDKETDNIVQLAKQCPVDYPDREFCGLARDPACVELVAALQAAGYVHLAKAAVCGISWSRRISAGFDLAYLEEDAAEPGWSWNRPIVCTCPVLDGHEVTGSSCPLHGLPPAPFENTRGVNMDSVERRLAGAKLGAAIDYAIDCLPENYAVRVVLSRGRYAVQLLCDGRPGPCFVTRESRSQMMASDRIKKKPPKDTTMPAGQWSGDKCPECGSRLVTDGNRVWCMRRDAETQRCLFVRVR